jgi:predicted deacylase
MMLALIGPACVRVLAALLALPATSCVVQAPASDTPGAVAVRTVTPGAVASSTVAAGMRRSAPVPGDRPAVTDVRVLGTTREGRRIRAYRVGDRTARRSAVVLSTMHGDERATRHIVTNLRDGAPVHGIDLWLVPMYNPDGFAARDRYNSRGVDLNRNFPRRWTRQPDSGRRPRERAGGANLHAVPRPGGPGPGRLAPRAAARRGHSHDKRPVFLRRLS